MNFGISNSTQDHGYFQAFTRGKEAGLAYLYRLFHKKLISHGLHIVSDEFVVNSAIQEAFLKAWNFRERLTSVLHTYRFLRLNVTWKCYNYYREPGRLHNRILYTDNIESYADIFYQPDDTEQVFTLTEERLQSIYKVLPYLPPTRKTIFTLYYKYGLSYNQIAGRFACSGPAIHHELQKGIELLKKVIHTKKKLDNNCSTAVNKQATIYPECLQGELLQLFRLRYENKWSFETIAEQMNLPLRHVQQQYITAHRLLNQMKKAG
jgi:RNA polymerase sigma factor (sigma-70 family)